MDALTKSHFTTSSLACFISQFLITISNSPLSSAYPTVCDSQCPTSSPDPVPSAPSLPQHDGDASRLEAQFVHQVYEEIASHFSSTRHSPWPRVRDFLLALPAGALLADVGCGNGKYLGINPGVMSVSDPGILRFCYTYSSFKPEYNDFQSITSG